MKDVTPKTPYERVPLTFDFSAQLADGETLTGTPTVTVRALKGLDGTPASRLSGAATIVGDSVQQLFADGPLSEIYLIACRVDTTSNQKLELVQRMAVRDPADT